MLKFKFQPLSRLIHRVSHTIPPSKGVGGCNFPISTLTLALTHSSSWLCKQYYSDLKSSIKKSPPCSKRPHFRLPPCSKRPRLRLPPCSKRPRLRLHQNLISTHLKKRGFRLSFQNHNHAVSVLMQQASTLGVFMQQVSVLGLHAASVRAWSSCSKRPRLRPQTIIPSLLL